MKIMGNEVSLPESSQAKFWTWIIGIVIASIGGWIFLETMFVLRAEGMEMKKEYTSMIAATTAAQAAAATAQAADSRETRTYIEWTADNLTKRDLDAQLFKLRQIPESRLSPQDRAVKARIETDRGDLVELWKSRSRPLR